MWRRNSVSSASGFYDMFSDSSSTSTTSSEDLPGFIAVPFANLDMNDENSENIHPDLDPWRQGQGFGKDKMYQAYRGQLQLAVYANYGLLTVHVMSAKHLRSRCKAMCDSYIKMCVIPDQTRRTRCKTDIIRDTNSPVYDEKFSFELLPEDVNKRLLISVWHKSGSNQCEFLGCMTFGIRHIESGRKEVNGWYYLLTSEVGKKKHLQVTSKRDKLAETGHKKGGDLTWMEHHTITLKRKKGGFGIGLSGACPVIVSRVDAGSYADQAGLKKDDAIMRIDGLNVTRSSCDNVARIIKHIKTGVTLEVQRAKQLPQNRFPMEQLDHSPRQPLRSSTPRANHADVAPGPCPAPPQPKNDGRRALFTIHEEEPQPNFETRDYGWVDGRCHDDEEIPYETELPEELLKPPKDYGWVDEVYDAYPELAPTEGHPAMRPQSYYPEHEHERETYYHEREPQRQAYYPEPEHEGQIYYEVEPQRQTYLPEGQTYLPEGHTYLPEGQTYLPEHQGKTYLPERQTYLPEHQGQTYLPEGQTYLPEHPGQTYLPDGQTYLDHEVETYLTEPQGKTYQTKPKGRSYFPDIPGRPSSPPEHYYKETVFPAKPESNLPDLIENHNVYAPMHTKKIPMPNTKLPNNKHPILSNRYPTPEPKEQYIDMHPAYMDQPKYGQSSKHVLAERYQSRNHFYESVGSMKSTNTSHPSMGSSGYSTGRSGLQSNLERYQSRSDLNAGCLDDQQPGCRDDSFIHQGALIETHIDQMDKYATLPHKKKVSFKDF